MCSRYFLIFFMFISICCVTAKHNKWIYIYTSRIFIFIVIILIQNLLFSNLNSLTSFNAKLFQKQNGHCYCSYGYSLVKGIKEAKAVKCQPSQVSVTYMIELQTHFHVQSVSMFMFTHRYWVGITVLLRYLLVHVPLKIKYYLNQDFYCWFKVSGFKSYPPTSIMST